VLDTTVLVALQRQPHRLLALLDTATKREYEVHVPAAALTEFLGGSPPALRSAADYAASRVEIPPVTEPIARRAAALQRTAADRGARRLPGPIDAILAASAEVPGSVLVFDGDRVDFEALADASGRLVLKELREVVR
jgi:predicted nucleic acid-binding protein